MKPTIDELKVTFGKLTELYDKVRVSYPQEVMQGVFSYANLSKDAAVLEVGCGTGQATEHLLNEKCNLTAIDISKEMITYLQKKIGKHDNTKLLDITFENFEAEVSSFKMILSAQAWHWIEPTLALTKAASLLKEDGTLALIWNWQNREVDTPLLEKIAQVFNKYGEDRGTTKVGWIDRHSQQYEKLLKEHPRFTQVKRTLYKRTIEFSKEKHLGLLMTFSWVQRLTQKERYEMQKEIECIYEEFNEPLTIPYIYATILAKKSSQD